MPLRRNVVVFSGVFSLFKLISLIYHSLVDEEPIILNTTEVPAQILPEQVPADTCPREPPIWSSTRGAAPTRSMFPMTMASSNTSVYWEDLFVSASPQDNTREFEKETGLKSTTREEQIIPEKIPADISSCTNNSACGEDLLVCASMKNDTSILSSLEDAPTPLMTPVTEIAGTEPKPESLDDVDVHERLEFHSPEYEKEEEEIVEVSWESIVSVIFIILDLYWIVSSLKKWIKRLEKISTNTKYNCKKRKRWRKLP